ncbi:MAG: protein BatD [Gammaproteobacteria bacterium]|nr:protein BatD [Gammaproteobacteria bacterium]
MKPLSWILLYLLLVASPIKATITATVDRNQISEFDLLNLTIRSSDSQTRQPDFSALEKDFEIVNSQNLQNSSYTFINGQQTSRAYIDYTLKLRPKRTGKLEIPALTINNETTQPIPIRVIQQSNAMRQQMQEVLFFETELDATTTYVQAQIIYSVKLYYSESISGDFPAAPDLEDAVVEILEEEKRYETILNNRRFYVLEKRYAIFPQKSGPLLLPKETFVGTRGRGGLFSARQRVSAISTGHRVQVKPVPPAFTGEQWLPGKNLMTDSKLNLPEAGIKVGEPLNQVISVSMQGVSGLLLPDIKLSDIPGAKIYVDQPIIEDTESSNGISTLNRTTIGIVPTQAGSLVLPEIRIPWWNIELDRQQTAIIPGQTIDVKPLDTPVLVPPIMQGELAPVGPGTSSIDARPQAWKWVSMGLLTVWLLTALGWYLSRRGERQPNRSAPQENQVKTDTRELLAACQGNDAELAHHLLLRWLRSEFPAHQSATTLAALQPAFATAFLPLEKAVFSGNTADWQGQALIQAIKGLQSTTDNASLGSTPYLAKALNPGL